MMGGTEEIIETGNSPNVPTPKSSPGENDEHEQGTKKHPPPLKPRPPSPPPNEVETPPTSVDLDGSTSEDDTPVRRQSSRQSKKQKRAHKQNETKEDHTILKEMKTPIPSTSGPLIREQEKIKRMYPRKFQPSATSKDPNVNALDNTVSPQQKVKSKEKEKSVKDKFNGAIRKSARIDKRGNDNDGREVGAPRVITRNIARVITKHESDCNQEEEKVNSPERPSDLATPTNSLNVSNANIMTENENFCANNLNSDPTIASLSSLSRLTPTPSPPKVNGPILKEKRQRKLPKRLMSPDLADLPPVLFRIASSGAINIASEDEGPPKLSPMIHYPQVSRSRKRPGKENQLQPLTGRKLLHTTSSVDDDTVDKNRDVDDDDKTEDSDSREPARKRVARARTASTGTGNHPKKLPTPKTHEIEEIKTRMGTRASSRKSNT